MFRFGKVLSTALIGAAAFAAAGSPMTAKADSGADFFKGKKLSYIIATKPGGGYDTYGRLTAKYMGKHMGARFIVKNIPGAGHIVGANTIYASKADGTTIGMFNTGLIHAQVLKREGVQFDLTKMSWIGKAAADPRVLVVGKESGINSIGDLRGSKKIKFAASGVGSASYNDTKLLISALGLNAEVIPGFGGNEGEMSMLRGEVAGQFGSYSSMKPFVDNGHGKFVFHVGGGNTMGSLPSAESLATSADGKSLIALIASQAQLARFTAAPAGIPADRLAALRAAYKKSMTDPDMLAEAKKLNIPIVPLYGNDVAARVKAAVDQPPQVVAMVKAVIEEGASMGPALTTALLSVKDGGKKITFSDKGKTIKSKVSGSRTKITVNGKEASRKALSAGMVCGINYTAGGKNEPQTLDCIGATALLSVKDGGKKITFERGGKTIKSKVSGSRTKITVGGKGSDRKALKKGMQCVIDYTPGGKNEPKTIDCT